MDDGDYPVTWLVDRAAAGDEQAWQEIVERYAPLLASVIRRYQLTTAEAQDVGQIVWLRLVEHLGNLREPRALPMWIITTAKRESMRYVSDRRRTVPYDPLDPSWQSSSAEDPELVAGLLKAERHEALLAGLAELPERQRELLLMLVADPPLSYAEISQRTGIPVGSIGPTRGRALDRLRQTHALRDHLTGPAGPAGAPAAPDGGTGLDRATARGLDRPRER
jgi:RNA polymerase sigma factor (sigma-70 family)